MQPVSLAVGRRHARATRFVPSAAWIALALAAACASRPVARSTPAAPVSPGVVDVYFGTYTKDGGSRGIYRSALDLQGGALSPPTLAAPLESPSFLALHPTGRFLYAVSEISDPARGGHGLVTAFAIEADGGLRPLGHQPSGGAGPCYVAVDPAGKRVVVANYGGGSVASFPVLADGTLGAAASVIRHTGSGPDPRRQQEPHAHSILFDPKGRRAFAADLGIDKVLVYAAARTGALTPNRFAHAGVAPGAGPRHLAFHPSGRFLYANNEMASTVTAFAHDDETGELRELQTLSTLPAGAAVDNSTAQILTSADGRFVYVSNRGHDSIAIFAADPASGALALVGHEPSGGKTPRTFNIDPTGAYLVAANQSSGDVVVFRIDRTTGRLAPTGHQIELSQPVCVAFAERRR